MLLLHKNNYYWYKFLIYRSYTHPDPSRHLVLDCVSSFVPPVKKFLDVVLFVKTFTFTFCTGVLNKYVTTVTVLLKDTAFIAVTSYQSRKVSSLNPLTI